MVSAPQAFSALLYPNLRALYYPHHELFRACAGSARGPGPAKRQDRHHELCRNRRPRPWLCAATASSRSARRAPCRPWIGPRTQTIDLHGMLAIPGLIEGHGHFLGIGEYRLGLDLRDARTWDDIVAQVARAAKEARPGEWIVGRGWHQSKWDRPPEPNVEGFPLHASLERGLAQQPRDADARQRARGFRQREGDGSRRHHAGTRPTPRAARSSRTSRATLPGCCAKPPKAWRRAPGRAGATPAQPRRARPNCAASSSSPPMSASPKASPASRTRAPRSIRWTSSAQWRATIELRLRLWVMVSGPNEQLAANLDRYRTIGDGDEPSHRARHQALYGRRAGLARRLAAGTVHRQAGQQRPQHRRSRRDPQRPPNSQLQHGYQLCVHAIGDRANRETLDIYEQAFRANADAKDLRWRIEHAQHLSAATFRASASSA